LLVTGFLVKKLILSSIIGHHGLVAKKSSPFREAAEPNKNNRFSTYKSTGKNYNIGDLNDGAYNKVSKWLLAPKPKQMYLSLESKSILRIWPKKVLEPLPFVMLGIF
jgi:hypothetical protein